MRLLYRLQLYFYDISGICAVSGFKCSIRQNNILKTMTNPSSTQLGRLFPMSFIPFLFCFFMGILWIYLKSWFLMYDLPYETVDHPAERSKDTLRYCNFHSSPPVLPKCLLNNTYCGDWSIQNRSFHPAKAVDTNQSECSFRLFTPQEARQCLGKRTLVFVGDSQNRDLSIAVGLFLQGRTVEESYDHNTKVLFKHIKRGSKMNLMGS